MEFILSNYNYFYLIGLFYFICCVREIISRAKKDKKIDMTIDLRNVTESFEHNKEAISKEVSKFSWVASLINATWIIIGIIYYPERNLFVALILFGFIVPMFLGISSTMSMLKDVKEEGLTKLDSEMVKSRMDVKKHKRFYSFINFVEIAIIIVIAINHFKLDLFYAFQ